jgi:hypothetical protein
MNLQYKVSDLRIYADEKLKQRILPVPLTLSVMYSQCIAHAPTIPYDCILDPVGYDF